MTPLSHLSQRVEQLALLQPCPCFHSLLLLVTLDKAQLGQRMWTPILECHSPMTPLSHLSQCVSAAGIAAALPLLPYWGIQATYHSVLKSLAGQPALFISYKAL